MDRKPTKAELEILTILWKKGPCSVRAVHEEMNRRRRTGYTTVLKFLQIMTEKELVSRDETSRAHVYTANLAQGDARLKLLEDLAESAFGGSTHELVMYALTSKKVSPAAIGEVKTLVAKIEEAWTPNFLSGARPPISLH